MNNVDKADDTVQIAPEQGLDFLALLDTHSEATWVNVNHKHGHAHTRSDNIKDTTIANGDETHASCCTCMSVTNYPEVYFVLHLKRKALYYIMNIVVPSIVLSVLVLLVLWLPPESGERISMGVTLLLSFTVFLMMVAENVPHTSDAVPLIGL